MVCYEKTVGSASVEYEMMDDLALIECVVASDEAAVAFLLVDRCGEKLKYLALSRFKTLGLEFEEVISELFLHLQKNDWKALRDFRGASRSGRSCKLEGYISLIASRLLWKKMDRAMKEPDWVSALVDEEGNEVYPAVDESSDRLQIQADVLEMIQRLKKPKERLVLMKYKIEGYSTEEVAVLLKTSPANVYTLCNRAIHNLRELLENEEVCCG